MKSTRAPSRTIRDLRRRTYSQNFIRRAALANELVALASVRSSDHVIEPGAGRGILTEPLVEHGAAVTAVELDSAWAAQLREKFADKPNVKIVEGDFFKYELPRKQFRVFGNIPFAVTTRMFHHLLDDLGPPLARCDLIVQWEVAAKRAMQSDSSLLGLSWRPWFTFNLLRRIPANEFQPVPRVDAALLSVRRRTKPPIAPSERNEYIRFLRIGFSHGGFVRAGLRHEYTKAEVRQLRRAVSFTDETRAASLGFDQWIVLYEAAKRLRQTTGAAGRASHTRSADS
jgi:23S rRNA (adenine-N6)-dimethyltransferase